MLKVIPARKGASKIWEIQGLDLQNPCDIFFDTNVWISMNDEDINKLKRLRLKYGFRYRYSFINFVELVSHLHDLPTKRCKSPFNKYRNCFVKIDKVCHHEVLPLPELKLLQTAGLHQFIDECWKFTPSNFNILIDIIINSKDIDEVTGRKFNDNPITTLSFDPQHYKKIRDTDEESFKKLLENIKEEIERPIKGNENEKINKLLKWFNEFVLHFFWIRTCNKYAKEHKLTDNEYDRLLLCFTKGAGRLLQTHFIIVIKKTINSGRRIVINDIYDMMQLLLLQDNNRLFVTGDDSFFEYQLSDDIQRYLPWSSFRKS